MSSILEHRESELNSKLDKVLELLLAQESKREDDSLMLTSLIGHMTKQGERLKRVESFVKQGSSDSRTVISNEEQKEKQLVEIHEESKIETHTSVQNFSSLFKEEMVKVLESDAFKASTGESSTKEISLHQNTLECLKNKGLSSSGAMQNEILIQLSETKAAISDLQKEVTKMNESKEYYSSKQESLIDFLKSEDFHSRLRETFKFTCQDELNRCNEMDSILSFKLNELLLKFTDLETKLISNICSLKTSIDEVESRVNHQNILLSRIDVLDDKLKRLTKVSIFLYTKLRKEVESSTLLIDESKTDIVDNLDDSKQMRSILHDELKQDLGDKMMALTETVMPQFEQFMLKDDLDKTLNSISRQLQTIQAFSDNQTAFLDQVKKKITIDFSQKLDTVWLAVKSQMENTTKIQGEFTKQGSINEMLSERNAHLIDQMIAEGQLIREAVKGDRQQYTSYMCDFHILHFSKYQGTDLKQFSRVWFIQDSQTYIKSYAHFKSDMDLDIYLSHGYSPRALGLKPNQPVLLKVQGTVVRQSGLEDNISLGIEDLLLDDSNDPDMDDGWEGSLGQHFASIPCQALMDMEMVHRDTLLLRFEISSLAACGGAGCGRD